MEPNDDLRVVNHHGLIMFLMSDHFLPIKNIFKPNHLLMFYRGKKAAILF